MISRIREAAPTTRPFTNPPISCIMSQPRNVVLEGEEGRIEFRPRPRTGRYRAQDMVEGATDLTSRSAVVVQDEMLTQPTLYGVACRLRLNEPRAAGTQKRGVPCGVQKE